MVGHSSRVDESPKGLPMFHAFAKVGAKGKPGAAKPEQGFPESLNYFDIESIYLLNALYPLVAAEVPSLLYLQPK